MAVVDAGELKAEGSEAHRKRLRRTDNPHLIRARLWDEGWLRKEKESKPSSKLPTFWKWLREL